MVKNFWYAILASKEVQKRPVGIRRFEQNLVLWRTSDGSLHCMEDRCPHRGTKLSLGTVIDNELECGFHGFRFGQEGACHLIPSNGKACRPPRSLKIKTHIVREARGIVWFWWGDGKRAELVLPEFSDFDEEDGPFFTLTGTLPVSFCRVMEANLDFSHFFFVHRNYFTARPDSTYAKRFRASVEGNRIELTGKFCKDTEKERECANAGIEINASVVFPGMAKYRSSLEPQGCMSLFFHAPIDEHRTYYLLKYYIPKGPFAALRMGLRRVLLFELLWKRVLLKQDLRVWLEQMPLTSGANKDVLASQADVGIAEYLKMWKKNCTSQKERKPAKFSYSPAYQIETPENGRLMT